MHYRSPLIDHGPSLVPNVASANAQYKLPLTVNLDRSEMGVRRDRQAGVQKVVNTMNIFFSLRERRGGVIPSTAEALLVSCSGVN